MARTDITEPPEVARLIDEVWTTFNSDEYDAAFVRVLRHLVSRFLEQNAQEEVNPDGSHEQNGHITYDVWAQSTAYQNMNNFINDSVLRMGEDAADVTLVACPYVLKVRVCIVMVHRDGDKPQIIEYGPSSFAATTSSSGGDPPLHREQSSALKSDHDHTKGGEASSTTGGSTTQGGSDVGGVVHSPASWPDAEDAAPSPFPSASPSASPPLPIVDCSDTHSGQVDLAPLPPQADSPSQSSRGSPASSSRDAISSPQPCCMMLHVLLRPGHYDVLYTTDRPEDAFVVMPRSERWEREKARPKMQLSVSTSSQNASSDGGEGGLVPWVARGGGGGGGDKTMASGNLRQRVAARWSRLLLTTQGIVESTGGLLSCLEELLRNQLERRRLQNDPCDADVVLGQLMSMIDPLRASLAELDTIPSSIFDDAATPPTTIATTQTRTHPPTALAAQGAALRQRVCSELVQYLQTCAEIPDDEVGTGGAAMAPQSEHQTAECQEVSGGSGEGEGGEANESDEVEVYHTPVSSSRHADRRDGEGEGDGNDGNQPTHHRDTQDRPLTEGSLHPPPAIPCKSISDGAAALMTANDVDDGWGDFGEGQEEDNHDHCAVDTAIEVSLAAIDGNDTAADDAEASEGFVSAASPVPASLPPLDSPVTAASRGTEGSPSPCALSLEPVVWRGGGGGGGDDHDHCGTIVLSPPVEQADLPAAAVAIDDDPGAAGVRVGVGVGLREEPTATATATPDVQETPVLEMHGGNVPMQRRQGEGEAATPMAAGVGDFAQNNSSSSRTQMCCVCLRDGVVDVEGEGEGGRDEREGEGEGGQPLLRLQRLHCGVYIHLDCLREYWRGEVRRHGSVLVDVACPVASCDSVLTAEDLQRAVSHDFRESLKSELEQESAANLELIQQLQNERDDDQRDTPTFQCAICLYEHPVDGSVTLPCPSSHRFCKPCIARHFEEVVMSRRVDKLTCPLPDCLFDLRAQLEQHYSMFQSLLQPKSFQKLLHSLAT
ncbi:unnamed protein product [Vitrella brassicaformis CCMP3155]|uniref:RING-type domain-containing protein n=3 Tax=Vitrella brassicaformis TaxID=1169539 RepID=A0A0G4FG00_VITBC|nr:unnamed protein product [Vitrella brassicaformis CCMP3155]|eukprot:CEM12169.1 unnamed protein product [Vitrella brassicaformis CCMP3155]